MQQWPQRIVIFLIQLYRTWVSPMRLPTCRFEPTCSSYAVASLERYGLLGGGWLAVIRILKCGPWHRPGYDPVPDRWDVLGRHHDVERPREDPMNRVTPAASPTTEESHTPC
ncbi:membrane protein insertion efficiency factor YidD [Williamsia sterculiae]|uniref:Putative membrane protein insertion efficiency factor n=1 Tax=Williamsia sterculiae TaxID=1344003 RepID=A0A1N7FG28_9NOCA|nr:membrane protein insertion efficiency factor YidD [Williamsia sterculiae]SIR99244.1 putative membrane protein insertion efficiency factor [Williamsia sterculiae]